MPASNAVGCQLVTAVDCSRLGVAGGGTSTAAVGRGLRRGGLQVSKIPAQATMMLNI